MKIPLLHRELITSDYSYVNIHAGEKMALELFHNVAKRVPAYGDFLNKKKVDHTKIRTYDDFKRYVPIIDKANYLTQYSLAELSLDGDIFTNRIISVSSGSSGKPFYWPRGLGQDQEGTEMHTEIYDTVFNMQTTKTLVVICFSMGTWIAGSFTTASSFGYAEKGRPVNIVTPGLEKGEAINAIKNLSGNYEQVVIVGYPPFVKDIIEEGARSGIKWRQIRTRLLMAGESFSEEWRDYVLRLVASKDPYFDSINIYGSADAGILGNETPTSIVARRIYNKHSKLRKEVFDTDILPSLIQYDPTRRHFEEVGGELIFTAMSGIPLIRYNIKDTGGVLSYEQIVKPIESQFALAALKHGIDTTKWQKPFLYLNGRKDFSVTIYAVNIYPENIKAALIDRRLRHFVTGRFTMATKNYSDMDQYFEINIELAKNLVVERKHQTLVDEVILHKLLKNNAEFHKLYAAVDAKALPKVHLVEFGDAKYFTRGVKHKWVEKD